MLCGGVFRYQTSRVSTLSVTLLMLTRRSKILVEGVPPFVVNNPEHVPFPRR